MYTCHGHVFLMDVENQIKQAYEYKVIHSELFGGFNIEAHAVPSFINENYTWSERK